MERLKGDLDYLRLNLKYEEAKKNTIEAKVFETIDHVQEVIKEFFELMSSMKQAYPETTAIEEIKDLVVDKKKPKLESSLSEPNLYANELKISKGF